MPFEITETTELNDQEISDKKKIITLQMAKMPNSQFNMIYDSLN